MTGQATEKARRRPIGFGFDPAESEHHFVVTVPGGRREVQITEHLHVEAGREPPPGMGAADPRYRVILPRAKWEAIADEARAELNRRLRRQGLPPGRWKRGDNPVARLLGKELTLLAWAVEDADPTLIPVAIRNWLGLAAEERWWLFTMTSAATGHALHGRGKGWRKAVRFALTENPVTGDHDERRADLFRLVATNERMENGPGSRPEGASPREAAKSAHAVAGRPRNAGASRVEV